MIAVHGLGTTRELAMNVMEFLHRSHVPVLALAYRGDLGAPRPPDGLNHFGETEWRDLDAAIRYAVRYGARQVVLHGWSTGATMALRAAAHSGLRDRVSGLVLDSPALSWETTRAPSPRPAAPRVPCCPWRSAPHRAAPACTASAPGTRTPPPGSGSRRSSSTDRATRWPPAALPQARRRPPRLGRPPHRRQRAPRSDVERRPAGLRGGAAAFPDTSHVTLPSHLM
ncbi:hypothetical protein SCYAM73S_00897 [Streptomyces cyaneofuscatus]